MNDGSFFPELFTIISNSSVTKKYLKSDSFFININADQTKQTLSVKFYV